MTTLRVLRIQTPSVPVASTIAALERFAPSPKPATPVIAAAAPESGAPVADARAAYAEF